MYDAPGMRVTPDSRGYGVSMPFAAHAAAEPPSQLQATLVKSAKDVFAGTMGGIIVTAIGHPFDTVKVLLQTQPANNPIYSGPIDAVSKVLKSEGIGGLYKGITSPLAGQMFFRATLFFGYAAKEIVGVSPDDPLSYFRAGVLAWAAGTMFESPIDLYKSQWQSMIIKAKQTPNFVPPYKNVGECVRASIKLNGIRGPYQGLSGAMARNLPRVPSTSGCSRTRRTTSRRETRAARRRICRSWRRAGSAASATGPSSIRSTSSSPP